MLRIPCPWCGPRIESEFTYGGDAGRAMLILSGGSSTDDWQRFVYLRDNPRGDHLEFWHHSFGCGQWFRLRRDTATDAPSDDQPDPNGPVGQVP